MNYLIGKNIQKYSVFVSLFCTQIWSKQAKLFVFSKKWIPFLKSNNVKCCQILSNCWHFGTFLVIFEPFFALFDVNKKKSNNYSFWIHFSDLNQIIYSFWFVGIWHYSAYYGESCGIICFNSFCLIRFTIQITSFLFISICFRIQTL